MEQASDHRLVMQTRGGEVEAFGELVRRYQTSVYNVCYRLLGVPAEAEDMAQEAFLRAYRRLNTYDAGRPFGPWMRRVAANLCLTELQRRRPVEVELDEEVRDRSDAPWSAPEFVRERRETARRVRQALLSLPERYRAVVELRHYHELSYDAIAADLGITVGDVRTRLFRARRKLADLLRADDQDETPHG